MAICRSKGGVMNEIKLTAKTSYETMILEYLAENASEMLAERINNGTKTLSQCWNYIMSEARRQAQNGCACIEDKVVYGWAIHFFEEDSINGEKHNKAPSNVTIAPTEKIDSKPRQKKKVEAPAENQMSLLDLFGV